MYVFLIMYLFIFAFSQNKDKKKSSEFKNNNNNVLWLRQEMLQQTLNRKPLKSHMPEGLLTESRFYRNYVSKMYVLDPISLTFIAGNTLSLTLMKSLRWTKDLN